MSQRIREKEIELSETDLKLLKILQENADLTYAELSKYVNLSPSTVYVRIKRLKEMGIIKRIVAEIDHRRLGFEVKALIFIEADPKKLPSVANELKKLPNIVALYDITGEYHFVAIAIARDNSDLARILDIIGSIDGVRTTKTAVVLRILKEKVSVADLIKPEIT